MYHNCDLRLVLVLMHLPSVRFDREYDMFFAKNKLDEYNGCLALRSPSWAKCQPTIDHHCKMVVDKVIPVWGDIEKNKWTGLEGVKEEIGLVLSSYCHTVSSPVSRVTTVCHQRAALLAPLCDLNGLAELASILVDCSEPRSTIGYSGNSNNIPIVVVGFHRHSPLLNTLIKLVFSCLKHCVFVCSSFCMGQPANITLTPLPHPGPL